MFEITLRVQLEGRTGAEALAEIERRLADGKPADPQRREVDITDTNIKAVTRKR